MPFDTDSVGRASAESAPQTTEPETIATQMTFAAPRERVWRSLLFYEEVRERPPLHLRLLLPVPVRTDGDKTKVGGKAMCVYERGHLVKQATRIEEPTLYEFEVSEQALTVGGTMRLCGGRYELREVAPARTEVTVRTRYRSAKWPRWFWRPLERFVCHMFHRFLLRTMRRDTESS